MPSTYTSLHYHIVFATKNREPTISSQLQERFHTYLGGIVRGMDGQPHAIGGMADHVHVLVGLKPIIALADFMRELKKASTAWMQEDGRVVRFAWQEGYGAFSVSAPALPQVQEYIARQQEHHARRSYREEFLDFLRKAGVPYDERFVD